MQDRIYIRELTANCIIGINPRERVTRQNVVIDMTIECNTAPAARSDHIADTIDYALLRNEIVAMAERSAFFLIETLADRIASLCLKDARVNAVTVSVDKPGALTGARSVAVEIRRERESASRGA